MIYNDDRPEHIRSLIYLCVLVLFVGYQIINVFVPNADLIIGTRVLAASVYACVLYIYFKDAWRAFRAPEPERSDFLIVGIWLSFLSHLLQTTYAVVYRLADAPKWLLNAEIVAPIVLLSVVAGVLHVTAPGAYKGTIPPKDRFALGLCIGAAVLVIGVLVATRPDIRPLIDRARPWISDWYGTNGNETSSP